MMRNSIPDFPRSVRVLLIHLKMSVQKAKKHSRCINFWMWQCGLQLKHLHIISFISPDTECVNSEEANVILRSVGRRTFQTRQHLKAASTALTLPEHFTWMFFISQPSSLSDTFPMVTQTYFYASGLSADELNILYNPSRTLRLVWRRCVWIKLLRKHTPHYPQGHRHVQHAVLSSLNWGNCNG